MRSSPSTAPTSSTPSHRGGCTTTPDLPCTARPSQKHFISPQRGYHGSSSTGAGLTALPAFHRGFDLPLPTQHYIESPYAYRHPQGGDAQALIAASVAALRAKVSELGADKVA